MVKIWFEQWKISTNRLPRHISPKNSLVLPSLENSFEEHKRRYFEECFWRTVFVHTNANERTADRNIKTVKNVDKLFASHHLKLWPITTFYTDVLSYRIQFCFGVTAQRSGLPPIQPATNVKPLFVPVLWKAVLLGKNMALLLSLIKARYIIMLNYTPTGVPPTLFFISSVCFVSLHIK